MAISLTQVVTNGGTEASVLEATLTNVAAGDTLVLIVGSEDAIYGVSSVSDTQGNSYAASPASVTGNNANLLIYTATAKSSGSLTVTAAMTGFFYCYCFFYDLAGVGSIVAATGTTFSTTFEPTIALSGGTYQIAVMASASGQTILGVSSPFAIDATQAGLMVGAVASGSGSGSVIFSTSGGQEAGVIAGLAFVASSGGGGSALTNLTGQTVGTVLTTIQFSPVLDDGAFCDQTVYQGTISGLGPSGNGAGVIAPIGANLGTLYPSLVEGNRHPLNLVRAAELDRTLPPYSNGQTVKFICVVTSAGDLTARLVT
jgi:hypothetical protein